MKNETRKIEVKDLIALCHMIDNFEEFNKNMIKLLETSNNKFDLSHFVNKLRLKSNGKRQLYSKKVNDFYEQNKEQINIIKDYSYVLEFIVLNYEHNKKGENLNYFYKYLKDNKDKLDNILSLLEKIQHLEIKSLEFNPDFDFTNTEYEINSTLGCNSVIPYVDNIEIIPIYSYEKIKYKTDKSDYKIELVPNFLDIYKGSSIICVNNLLFDPSKLPNNITKKETFEQILKLRDEKKDQIFSMRKTIDLDLEIDSLNNKVDELIKASETVDDLESKIELAATLRRIKNQIEELKESSKKYSDEVIRINKFPSDLIAKEKELK